MTLPDQTTIRRLKSYPYCAIQDPVFRARFEAELEEDARQLLGSCVAQPVRSVDLEKRAGFVFETSGDGSVEFCVELASSVRSFPDRLTHYGFEAVDRDRTLLPLQLAFGRRVHPVEFAPERRALGLPAARGLRPGADVDGMVAVRHPFLPRLPLRQRGRHWHDTVLALASLRAPARFAIEVLCGDPVVVDQARLENSVKLLQQSVSSLYSRDEAEQYLGTYRELYTSPERLWLRGTVSSEGLGDAHRIFSAFTRDTDPRAWTPLALDAPLPTQFEGQLAYLWAFDEAVHLLTPPYTTTSALFGLRAHRVLPFDAPPRSGTAGAVDLATHVHIGTLEDGGEAWLPTDHFKRGVCLFGVPRMGKSATARYWTGQLIRQGRTVLVIDPAGTDWRELMAQHGGRTYGFGPGLEPFCFNGFLPVGNHTVSDHCQLLARALAIAWPTTEFVLMALEALVRNLYVANFYGCGRFDGPEEILKLRAEDFSDPDLLSRLPGVGDLITNGAELVAMWVRGYSIEEWVPMRDAMGAGRPVALRPLTAHGLEVLQHMQRRLLGLQFSALSRLLTPPEHEPTRPFRQLLEESALLQLTGMGSQSEAAGLTALLLGLLYAHRVSGREHPGLRHALVLEEAHNIVPDQAGERARELVASGAEEMAELTCRILLETPKYGQMVLLIDQAPSAVRAAATSAVSYLYSHRLVSGIERERIAAAMALREGQREALGALEVGQGVMLLDGDVCLMRTPDPADAVCPQPSIRPGGSV